MRSKLFIPLAMLFLFFSSSLFSQQGWGSKYNNLYDVNTVETISGQVTVIDKVYSDNSNSYGVHLIIKTGSGDMAVHLGPGWYIEEQTVQINTNDNVTLTGSKVMYEGSQIIIAKEVNKSGQLLKLRDDKGIPVWSGWKNK